MTRGLLVVLLAASLAGAASGEAPHRFENRVLGYTIELPAGWDAAVYDPDGSLRIATYAVAPSGSLSARPPRGGTWIYLGDGGPLWALPRGRRGTPLPTSLPAAGGIEGVGLARRMVFRESGHEFLAFVKGRPRGDVLRILGSIRFTRYGRSLANVHTVHVVGRSVQGRPIRVWRIGNPRSRERILVVGCIHGTECSGMAVTQQLVNLGRPIPVDIWVVQDLNPDGLAAATRQNAHGVDLNRNFGAMWKRIGRRGSFAYSGPRPWSERETRIARTLVRRIRPQVSVWFHQPQAVVRAWGPSIPLARRYARLARAPFRAVPWPNGTASNWQNHLREISFVVELPPGRLPLPAAQRYADAVLALDRH